MKFLLATFLAAHALIHISYVTPAPPLASAGMLLVFQPWLALGLVIEVALAWAVLVAGWRPVGSGT